jgi:hypothetical protein
MVPFRLDLKAGETVTETDVSCPCQVDDDAHLATVHPRGFRPVESVVHPDQILTLDPLDPFGSGGIWSNVASCGNWSNSIILPKLRGELCACELLLDENLRSERRDKSKLISSELVPEFVPNGL